MIDVHNAAVCGTVAGPGGVVFKNGVDFVDEGRAAALPQNAAVHVGTAVIHALGGVVCEFARYFGDMSVVIGNKTAVAAYAVFRSQKIVVERSVYGHGSFVGDERAAVHVSLPRMQRRQLVAFDGYVIQNDFPAGRVVDNQTGCRLSAEVGQNRILDCQAFAVSEGEAGAAVAVDFVFLLRSVNDGVSVDINVLRQNNVVSEFYGNGAARLVVANDFQQFVAA